MDGWVGGLLKYVAINAALLAGAGALLHAGRVAAVLRRLGRVVGRSTPPLPHGMPIERIAADLRRLRHDVGTLPAQMPLQRRRGVIAAYDDALLDACHALELATTLADLPDGMEHDLERLRVEEELRRSGLVLAS